MKLRALATAAVVLPLLAAAPAGAAVPRHGCLRLAGGGVVGSCTHSHTPLHRPVTQPVRPQ